MPVIRPARGTHLVVERDALPRERGRDRARGRGAVDLRAAVARPDADRHHRHRPRRPDRARPALARRRSPYLLDAVNAFFAHLARRRTTSSGAYAGVRPLISTGDPRKSVDISRKAELYETSSGMVTITGGKLTTWRRMAKETVDRIVWRDGSEIKCRTHEVPLGMPVAPADLVARPGGAREQLAGRYGHLAHDVLALGPVEPIVAGPAGPAGRGRLRRAARAGAHRRRRAAAAHAARADRGACCCSGRGRDRARGGGAWGPSSGGIAARRAREVSAFREEALAEGILPAP